MINVNSLPSAQKSCAPTLGAPFRIGLLAQLPRLRAFARSLARDPDRADDLVQETLAKAWAHRDKFKQGTNLGAWLFTILRNTYYGGLRSRRREVSDSEGHHAAHLVSAPAQLHYLELQSVANAFEGLTVRQREALFLVGVSGLTYQEAASIVGCAVGTIKSRVFRARLLLLDKLAVRKQPKTVPALGAKLCIGAATHIQLGSARARGDPQGARPNCRGSLNAVAADQAPAQRLERSDLGSRTTRLQRCRQVTL